jgi:hypothetical protein
MSIGPKHDQTKHKQHITHKLHARSQILITWSSQTATSYLMSCPSHRAMCPLLDMRLLIGEHHAMVYTQDKEFKAFMTWKHIFQA